MIWLKSQSCMKKKEKEKLFAIVIIFLKRRDFVDNRRDGWLTSRASGIIRFVVTTEIDNNQKWLELSENPKWLELSKNRNWLENYSNEKKFEMSKNQEWRELSGTTRKWLELSENRNWLKLSENIRTNSNWVKIKTDSNWVKFRNDSNWAKTWNDSIWVSKILELNGNRNWLTLSEIDSN